MQLSLSNQTKNKGLNNAFKPTTLYVSIPTVPGAPGSADLPNAEILFNPASNGLINLAMSVQLVVQEGTVVDRVFLSTTPLTNATTNNNLHMIVLTGEDIETYENNGVYIINSINVGVNT